MANTPWVRDPIEGPTTPTVVASLRDLEFSGDAAERRSPERLLDIARGVLPGELRTALEGSNLGHNTVLQEAWDSYPWPGGLVHPE